MSDFETPANAFLSSNIGPRTPKLAPAPVPQDTPWKATTVDGVASKPNFDSVESVVPVKKSSVAAAEPYKDSKRSTTGKEKWVPYAPVVPVNSSTIDSGSNGGNNNNGGGANSNNGNNGRSGRTKRQQNNNNNNSNSNNSNNSNSNNSNNSNNTANSNGGNNGFNNGNGSYRQRRSQNDRNSSNNKSLNGGSNSEKRKNNGSGSRGSNQNRTPAKAQSAKSNGLPDGNSEESADATADDSQHASASANTSSSNSANTSTGDVPVSALEDLQVDDTLTERNSRFHGRSNYSGRPGSSARRVKDSRYANMARYPFQGGYVHNGMPFPVIPMQQIMPPQDYAYTADYMFGALVAQINHYFSVDNLCRDMYLRKNMNNEGLVPLKVIADFNRVKTMTTDHNTVFQACCNASNIEVVGSKVRAAHNWDRWLLPETDRLPPGVDNTSGIADDEKLRESKEPKFQVEQAVPFVPKSTSL